MVKVVTREVIGFKIETTSRTDAVPTAAANAIRVENIKFGLDSLRMAERKTIKNTFGMEQAIYAGHLVAVSFDVPSIGSGTAGTAPPHGPLLRCASLTETIVASTSVTYAPHSDPSTRETGTLYYWQDGTLKKAVGCVCLLGGSYKVGDVPMLKITVIGHPAAETDVVLPTPTFTGASPVAVKAASFSIGGFGAVIDELTFDLGNVISKRGDMNQSNGFGDLYIVDRKVTGQINPEATTVAANSFEADFLAGTKMALTTGGVGAAPGNIQTMQMPQIYYMDISDGERETFRTNELPFHAVESSGDDEWSLAYT